MSEIADGHDHFCDCPTPFGHLLASIFPPGHTDRNLTVNEILLRDFKQKCRSGGREEENHGMEPSGADGGAHNIKQEDEEEEDIPTGEIEELLAAVEKEEDAR